MNNNTRIIHTKLYSKIAHEVLQSVEGNLSDGMWENSPAMEKYWRFSNVTTATDGEVLIEIKPESGVYDKYGPGRGKWLSNSFHDMTDTEVIKWFAAKVKHIMQTELKDENVIGGWKRDNDKFETRYLNYNEKITVRDVYFIYDFLLGRTTAAKYDPNTIVKVVCSPKSAADTKAEETRRANIAKLEAEWTEAHQKLDIEKRMKIQDIEAEFAKQLEVCNAKYKKLRDELKI